MERGLYDWSNASVRPRHDKNGNPIPAKTQILRDCGKHENYPNARREVWENDEFLALVKEERDRRDSGVLDVVASAVGEIEQVARDMMASKETIQTHIRAVFERAPDSEDPEALSPKDYVAQGLQYIRYIDEKTGQGKSEESKGIDAVVGALAEQGRITESIAKHSMDVLARIRERQDKELERAGLLMEGRVERGT